MTFSDKIKEFDAIVIGSGISGGWAAKELSEGGLKTLLLERGKQVEHVKDYPTANMYPFEFEHFGEVPLSVKRDNPIASKCSAFNEESMHFVVQDNEHPYIQEQPFDWIRGYQVGGKSLIWGRQTQRWSDFDFEGPARDGFAVDWPIRYRDLAPWYDHVERFAGISGNLDGLASLPDGQFLPPFPLNAVEDYFKKFVSGAYPDRHVVSARCAHLTKPQDIHIKQGRVKCQHRELCERGCPFGGYFSSNSSTIPWGLKTGNLRLRPHAVVTAILYDEHRQRASGVRVIDALTKEEHVFKAKIIFVTASAINTNLILLNSTSTRFPNGLGNDSGLLGKYVAFHHYGAYVTARCDGFEQFRIDGKNPSGGGYIPRFRNLHKQETGFLRGYAAGLSARRGEIRPTAGFGESFKQGLIEPQLAPWWIGSHMMGETIPKASNFVQLDKSRRDAWGVPLMKISVTHDDNDERMLVDYMEQIAEMYSSAGFTEISAQRTNKAPGLDIHEMGGVRMGKDPNTSLLNEWNQMHHCKNVFVTDGACMTSTSTQNPSLTYMAITARAASHAINELKKYNL